MVSTLQLARARRLEHGETLTLPRETWRRVPPGFSEIGDPVPFRAASVYRENRPTDPLLIRVDPDRITLRRERYHPRWHPLEHLRHDVLPDVPTLGRARSPSGSRRCSSEE